MSRLSARRAAFWAVLAVFALAPAAIASQILEVSSGSLTSYLAAKTHVQDAKPRAEQRAVNLDGSLREGSTLPLGIQGNPFENAWRGEVKSNGIRLDTGTWAPLEVDLSLPATVRWTIGRSFNARADDSGQYDSNGYQGVNWFQTSQPEIVLYDPAGDTSDTLYLVLGADRYVEFVRTGNGSDTYKAKNGAAGAFLRTGGSPDTWAYHDPNGMVATFFGFNTSDADHAGQIWKIVNAADDVAYVGHATNAATAIYDSTNPSESGYDSSGRILKAYDSAGRRFTYTYNGDTPPHLTQVKAETKLSGTWLSPTGLATVGTVDYTYYGSESYGDAGDLKTATVTLPLTDSGKNDIRTTYYRYWEGTYNSSTNPGYPHTLKLVVSPEGVRQFDWSDTTFDDDHLSASHDSLKAYGSAYFEYDSSHRVNLAWFQGQCGCSGAGTGTHEFSYATTGYTNTGGYDVDAARRTVVEHPDGSFVTQFFDETGQALSHVTSDADPSGASDKWVTCVERDATGCTTIVGTPASVTGYTHSTGVATLSTTNGQLGLIRFYARDASGDDTGFCTDVRWAEFNHASNAPKYYESSAVFNIATATKTVGAVTLIRPLQTDAYDYPTATTSQYSGANRTQYAYTTYSGTSQPLAIEDITTTYPLVTTGNNGRNAADGKATHITKSGLVDFEAVSDGTNRMVDYRAYTNGQLTTVKKDADTTSLSPPTGYSAIGTTINIGQTTAFDAQGRSDTVTEESGKVSKTYYSVLADRRLITIHYPKYVSGSGTFYGPASFSVRNLAGKVEAEGTIAISGGTTTSGITNHVDETVANPLDAIDVGTIARLTTRTYDETGSQLQSEQRYFTIPGSWPGSEGTNYDTTVFAYDDLGRQYRTKDATGTIRRTVFDAIGRTKEHWIGMNDSSFPDGESSGTDTMVKTDDVVYDGGSAGGNGLVTTRTQYVEGSGTGARATTYQHDVRGNALLTTNPLAPHFFKKYDNEDREIASGSFSSTGSITVGSDDPTTETANRLALSQTFFDERGRAWKTQHHKIDASDGSDDDNLQALTWWDRLGRVCKVRGEQLTKTAYDRLNRVTSSFTLANTDDTVYADALTVSGDKVLTQQVTAYETDSNNVLLTGRIDRFHTDYGGSSTSGELDTNGDALPLKFTAANVLGRIQITANWYDALDRLEDRVEYGTYAAADFNRSGLSVPSRSDTALRTSYVFNDDGTLKDVTDPKGLVTRTFYDAMGRRTKVVANYTDGTPGGGTNGDQDQTVLYAYTDGLQTSITADLPSGETDQVTTYTFGTTKGIAAGDSKIATGHLLQKVTYPDSTSGTDVVTFAYNAQSQQVWKKDQAGNVYETTFDDSGRETTRAVTTLASGFDGAVRRIVTAYDSLGRTETVTQYDAASSGAVVDQVKYTIDGWGNQTKFEQDRNGTVGGGGDQYTVQWAWTKPSNNGRNTLRQTSLTLPSGKVYSYNYRSAAGLLDSDSSRVTQVKDGETSLVTYDYVGVDQVVGTYYEEPLVMSKQYTSTAGDYADLDRFNRVVTSKWTKDLGTDVDFFNVAVGWDRNSNVTYQDDSVHDAFGAAYTNDDLNRLIVSAEGLGTGGTISTLKRKQEWTLTQTGNWTLDKLDLNGDADWSDPDEWQDGRTHNDVNELTARDLDNNSGTSGNNYSLAYDAAGNLTDDGTDYEYEWDALYRLRKVKKTSNQALVAEYRYNGLGYRIAEHADTDTDGDVDGNDKWFYFAYDNRWRLVATFRESDTSPKEEFCHHHAGMGGSGCYIDLVAFRDKDANTAWTTASDTVLEERLYYAQNWRADVVAIVSSAAVQKEQARYSAYGVPFGLPAGDADSDGDCDAADGTIVTAWKVAPSYDVRGDIDLDGDVDATDESAVGALNGATMGREVLSGVGNRKGYAGYEADAATARAWHVRNRLLASALGRWMQREMGIDLARDERIVHSAISRRLTCQYCFVVELGDRTPLALSGCPSCAIPTNSVSTGAHVDSDLATPGTETTLPIPCGQSRVKKLTFAAPPTAVCGQSKDAVISLVGTTLFQIVQDSNPCDLCLVGGFCQQGSFVYRCPVWVWNDEWESAIDAALNSMAASGNMKWSLVGGQLCLTLTSDIVVTARLRCKPCLKCPWEM